MERYINRDIMIGYGGGYEENDKDRTSKIIYKNKHNPKYFYFFIILMIFLGMLGYYLTYDISTI